MQGYKDATGKLYGYLLVDLTQSMDDRYRLRTKIFPGDTSEVFVPCINTRARLTQLHSLVMAHRVHNCQKAIEALEKVKDCEHKRNFYECADWRTLEVQCCDNRDLAAIRSEDLIKRTSGRQVINSQITKVNSTKSALRFVRTLRVGRRGGSVKRTGPDLLS